MKWRIDDIKYESSSVSGNEFNEDTLHYYRATIHPVHRDIRGNLTTRVTLVNEMNIDKALEKANEIVDNVLNGDSE